MAKLCGASRRLDRTTWAHCCKPQGHPGPHRVHDYNGNPVTWRGTPITWHDSE